MNRTTASSAKAKEALSLVESLQARFVAGLERFGATRFTPVEWLRDEGRHGGGTRFEAHAAFDNASVNVSQVHYDDEPHRVLASATALSTIVHPTQPLRPSVHVHVSFTETKSGKGGWRLMADLNPSHAIDAQTDLFTSVVGAAIPALAERARAQGDRYFFIPALERHRGVTHFYVEDFSTSDFTADLQVARAFGEAAVDAYLTVLAEPDATSNAADLEAQRAYHTLYLFQVLTLDRGTTSGLLIHDQNDLGIMGSLPTHVDPRLLASWAEKVPFVQRGLVEALVAVLGADGHVTAEKRLALAQAVRAHYRAHPDALTLQAAGDSIPPTVANHAR